MNFRIAVFFALLLAACAQAQSSIIPIEGISLTVSLAKYDPIPAQAGDFAALWFDISNRGNQDAKNITFELVAKYPFILPDNNPVQTIDFLAGSSNKRIEYRLFVAKDAPDDAGEVEVNYYIGNAAKINKKFNITVNNTIETADLNALYVSAAPVPVVGSETNLSVDVVNADKGTAYYVIAKAESPVAAIERNEIFIGTLEPNDFDNVDFRLRISEGVAPGTYPVNLVFFYRDKDSKLFTENDTVEISVLSKAAAFSAPPPVPAYMYIVYILALLIAVRLLIPFGKWFIKPFRRKKR